MSTNDGEFEKFWREVEKNLSPIIKYEPTYRLYHDDHGNPLFYSTEDLPGNYVEIDAVAFVESSSHVRVVNGRLIKKDYSKVAKLMPGDSGTPCDPRDITVVVSDRHPNIKWQKNHAEN